VLQHVTLTVTELEGFTLKLFNCLIFVLAMFTKPALGQDIYTLGGKNYGEKDLSPAQQQQVFELKMQNHEQMSAIVDNALFDNYLDEESKKQNKSREDIEKKVLDVKEPSERAMKAWYEANKTRIPPNYQFDQIKGEISKIVKQEDMKKKRDDFLAKIKKDKKCALNLTKPEAPVVNVDTAGFPSKGKDSAKVTIVEFADYQCPHCKIAADSLKKVTERFKDKVKFIYLDFPINPSGISKVVAEGAHCAGEQGKYWDYHYKAFDSQATLDKESPAKLAKDLKLDEVKFKACIDGAKGKAIVEKSHKEGERIGVSGTPFVLINGKRYLGAHTVEAFSKEIETALK